MNTLEALLSDRDLKLGEFHEGFLPSLNENKYMIDLRNANFHIDVHQRNPVLKNTSLRGHIRAFNTSKCIKLSFRQPDIKLFKWPPITFETEVEPFNIIQHRSFVSLHPSNKIRIFTGLTNQNVIQQAQNLFELGIEYKPTTQNMLRGSLCFNAYTGNTLLSLSGANQREEGYKLDGTVMFNVASSAVLLQQAVLSLRGRVLGQQILAAFLADPYWHYYLHGNKSSDSHVQLKDSWLVLAWKWRNNFVFSFINDFLNHDAIVAATFQWKPFDHLTLQHSVTSHFEIQNQVNYRLNQNLNISYGIKVNLKDNLQVKYLGTGLSINL